LKQHVLSLVLALLLDFILGDRESWPHPVRWIGAGYAGFENYFHRFGPLQYWQGIVTVVLLAAISVLIPFLILHWIEPPIVRVTVEGFLLYWCLSIRNLSDEARGVAKAIRQKRMAEARKLLSRVVGRETQRLSSSEISRAVVETLGESFVDGFLSPVFWGLLGGAPAAFFFKAVSTGDSMIGHPEPPYRKFGWAAAKLDDFLNFIPARLSLVVLMPAAFLLGLSVPGLIRSFWNDRLKHASPNAAHGEAAFAGALGVRLGGINFYEGKAYRQAVLNASGRVCALGDISRAVGLLWAGAFVVLMILILVGWRTNW
jgi:adenosylcobinamide-phosphate synthase